MKTEVNDLRTLTKGPRWKKVVNIPNMLLKVNYAKDATYAVLNRQLNCSFWEFKCFNPRGVFALINITYFPVVLTDWEGEKKIKLSHIIEYGDLCLTAASSRPD